MLSFKYKGVFVITFEVLFCQSANSVISSSVGVFVLTDFFLIVGPKFLLLVYIFFYGMLEIVNFGH